MRAPLKGRGQLHGAPLGGAAVDGGRDLRGAEPGKSVGDPAGATRTEVDEIRVLFDEGLLDRRLPAAEPLTDDIPRVKVEDAATTPAGTVEVDGHAHHRSVIGARHPTVAVSL